VKATPAVGVCDVAMEFAGSRSERAKGDNDGLMAGILEP